MQILVLFDGHCGLCRRSVRWLRALDWLKRLRFVDFQNEEQRLAWALEIPYADLDRALHVKFPDGSTLSGFSAFRAMSWHLPPLWILAPLLYLPGMKFAGDRVYACIAERRKRCTHDACNR